MTNHVPVRSIRLSAVLLSFVLGLVFLFPQPAGAAELSWIVHLTFDPYSYIVRTDTGTFDIGTGIRNETETLTTLETGGSKTYEEFFRVGNSFRPRESYTMTTTEANFTLSYSKLGEAAATEYDPCLGSKSVTVPITKEQFTWRAKGFFLVVVSCRILGESVSFRISGDFTAFAVVVPVAVGEVTELSGTANVIRGGETIPELLSRVVFRRLNQAAA